MAVSPQQQQRFASSVAYADLDAAVIALTKANKTPVTIEAAIKYAKSEGSSLGSLGDCLNKDGTLKDDYLFAKDWVLVNAVNENTTDGTGLYACIIDTGDAHILACRGSELMTVQQHYRQDWYGADIKLLNSEMTAQEESLRKYMEANKDLLNSKPWVSTGHSLGGALADYAAVMSVVLGMDTYSGTYNFDGPGHSLEFIERYKDEIAQISAKMTHIKASIVGSILYDLPGVAVCYIETKDLGPIDIHFMKNWLTEDGDLVPRDKPGVLEYLIEKVTRGADRLPSPVGNAITSIINVVIEGIFWAKNFIEDHPNIAKTIAVAAGIFLITHLPFAMATVVFAWNIIKFVGAFLLAVTVGEIIIEALEAFVHAAIDGICKAVSWLSDKAKELYQAAKEWIASIKEYICSQTPGAKYASNNPEFRVDTEAMRNYANRLRTVNTRLKNLDRDLNDLYWQVGFLDLLDILHANIIIGYSPRIGLCQTYLNSSAEALENAERKVLGYMGG